MKGLARRLQPAPRAMPNTETGGDLPWLAGYPVTVASASGSDHVECIGQAGCTLTGCQQRSATDQYAMVNQDSTSMR